MNNTHVATALTKVDKLNSSVGVMVRKAVEEVEANVKREIVMKFDEYKNVNP